MKTLNKERVLAIKYKCVYFMANGVLLSAAIIFTLKHL